MVRASLRSRLYELWVKKPTLKAKEDACRLLKEPFQTVDQYYKIHGNYINKLLSEFRSYHNLGSGQKAHFPKHRICEWKNIPREIPGRGDLAVRLKFWGWREVQNRNGMWLYKGPRGSVHWYKGGLVWLYLKGELPEAKAKARAKELFSRAFRWFSEEQLAKYLAVPFKEVYKKWTFDVGAPMPRFDIRQFERSHGLRLFTDGSDPTSLHVGEGVPIWIDHQRQIIGGIGEVVAQFGIEIQEHVKLIKLWQEEAKSMRLMPIKRKKKRKVELPGQKSIVHWLI